MLHKVKILVDQRGQAWDYIKLKAKITSESDNEILTKEDWLFKKRDQHEDAVILVRNKAGDEYFERACIEFKLKDFYNSIAKNVLVQELNNYYSKHKSPTYVLSVLDNKAWTMIPKYLSDCAMLNTNFHPIIYKTVESCIDGFFALIKNLAKYESIPDNLKFIPFLARSVPKSPIFGISHVQNGIKDEVARDLLIKHGSLIKVINLELSELEASINEIRERTSTAFAKKLYQSFRREYS